LCRTKALPLGQQGTQLKANELQITQTIIDSIFFLQKKLHYF
jgi:hypothetical protein